MSWLRARAAATVLVAGLVFTAVAVLLLVRAEREAVDRRFDLAATRVVSAISVGIDDSVNLLRGGLGLFNASEVVTTAEFAAYVEALDLPRTHPAISGYAAVGEVAVERVDEFVQDVAATGNADFAIRPAPVAGRDERRPIVFNEPAATNAAAIGFDVLANPGAATATDRAVASGGPALTGPLTLVQEQAGQAGFVIYYPRPDLTAAARRAGTIAFLSAVHRGDDFLAGVFDATQTTARVHLRDRAGGGPTGDGSIGTWHPPGWSPDAGGRAETRTLDVLGRTWEAEVTAVAGTYGRVGVAPWLVGLLGVLASLGAAGAQRAVRGREAAAHRMAEALTVDLRAEEQRVRRANQELAAAVADLEDSNEELSRFAFVASHDLQEPLRMVAGFLGLLEAHLAEQGELDDEAREYLEYATDGAQRMSRLIQDLLLLSRVQRHELERDVVDTSRVVGDVLAVLRGRIEEGGATVEVRRTDPVVADATQLHQLVQNLVANALKFTRDDRPARVVVDAWNDESGHWHLAVTDNGIGVAPEFRDRIFDAFARLHRRGEYEGTGIGLAVCQRIARRHGGDLRAADGTDGGLSVIVDLPDAAAD